MVSCCSESMIPNLLSRFVVCTVVGSNCEVEVLIGRDDELSRKSKLFSTRSFLADFLYHFQVC